MVRGSGALPRFLDVVLIAAGAGVAMHSVETASQVGPDTAVVAFALFFSLAMFPAFGMYRGGCRRVFWQAVCVPVVAWCVVLAGALAVVAAVHREYAAAPDWIVCWAGISAALLVGARLVRFACRHCARELTVAIVGSGTHAAQLMRNVAAQPDAGYRVVLAFDPGVAPADPDAFAASVCRERVDELWIALPLSDEATIRRFTDLFRNELVNVRFVPDMCRLALFDAGVVDLAGTPAIDFAALPISAAALRKKDVFDYVFAFAALVVLALPMLAIALAVKLSSPGPVLFRQRRSGVNGKVFHILKFRSMRVHEVRGGVVQASRNDPRVTKVGAFLRRTSLDELPQFINVLKGEMSVVGPRPHAIEHDVLYRGIVDRYIHRYRIKPGITGWAQVNGLRGETDGVERMAARIEYDLHYLSHWSFGLDMKIVAMTVLKGMIHRNAY